MVTKGLNILNIARNFIRTNSIFTRGAFIYRDDILTQKDKIAEMLQKKLKEISNTEFGRKMRVARAYYTLEMSPPSFKEAERLKADIALAKEFCKSGCFKFMTVKQAWLMFLVGVEIIMWFYLGETVGKMHIVGYKV